jgi:hypothetical protein
MTLGDLQAAATGAGLDLVATLRPAGASLPVPAIVHFAFQHYSAVVDARDGAYLLRDPALGGDRWIDGAVLDAELTGYVLVPRGASPGAWRAATPEETADVRGCSCLAGGLGANEPKKECPKTADSANGGGGCAKSRGTTASPPQTRACCGAR